MGNSTFNNGHFHQVLFSVINSFGDSVCYFIGFTQAITHHTITITNHNDGGEAKSATSFYHLGYTLNSNDSFFKIDFACFYCTDIAY